MVLNYLHKDCKFQEFQGESLVLMLSAQISLFSSQYSPSIPPVPAAAHLLIISDICTERLIIYPGWRALITSSNCAHLNNRTKGTVKLCLVTRGVVTPSQLWAKIQSWSWGSLATQSINGPPFQSDPFWAKIYFGCRHRLALYEDFVPSLRLWWWWQRERHEGDGGWAAATWYVRK